MYRLQPLNRLLLALIILRTLWINPLNFFDNEECREILDDRGYDDQDKGVEIVDNRSTASPTQVTIGAKHTHNTTDTPFNKNYDQEKGGEIFDAKVDDYQEKGG